MIVRTQIIIQILGLLSSSSKITAKSNNLSEMHTFSLLLVSILWWMSISAIEQPSCTWEGEYFPGIPVIPFEGPDSRNLLAFRYYNASEVILGKPMKEWLRFSVAFWHSFRGDGTDPFGAPTRHWPWEDPQLDDMEQAKRRLEANFELLKKLGIEYWCFHDRDIAPEGKTLQETNAKLDEMVEVALKLQKENGVRLLWGTSQLFKHPRYMHGASTSHDPEVFAFAASQIKKSLEITQRLGGLGLNTWGGREGYHTLRNTNMKLELENYARFMKMLVEYKKEIGFDGQLYIEPKPQEPTKHQYDFDTAATFAFLLKNGMEKEFKIAIECNHATLSGHSCEHELVYASVHEILGSVDINTGDPQTGWDTDQFLTDITEATLIMAVIIKQGGIAPGGFNFDAKLRRESIDVKDLFYAHIGSMDALARGLRNAVRMIEEEAYEQVVQSRYKDYFETTLGQDIINQKIGFKQLEEYALNHDDPVVNLKSAHAEKFEAILNHYIN